jgi:hypothetical protein
MINAVAAIAGAISGSTMRQRPALARADRRRGRGKICAGPPTTDRFPMSGNCEVVRPGLRASTLIAPQPGETHRRAQLPRSGLLVTGDIKGASEADVGLLDLWIWWLAGAARP